MSFQFNSADQWALDRLVESILTAFASSEVTFGQTGYLIARILTMAADGNEYAVREWFAPARVAAWKKDCKDKAPQGPSRVR
ncbi:MAG TPA: hypothetical protein VFK86_06930 [Bauldia sp.]|nr:hypothetical protein [Bauldia sp.]